MSAPYEHRGASGDGAEAKSPSASREAPSPYDLVRDRLAERARGSLGAGERAALDAAMQSDPELREFAELYPELHEATEREARALSALRPRTTFASLERALASEWTSRESRWRRAAAVAALVVVCAGGWFWSRRADRGSDEEFGRSTTVTLHAIDPFAADQASSGAAPEPDASLEFPSRLRDYEPVADGTIQWIDSLDEGLAIARASERPVLLFGMYTTCPWCIHMQANGLRDETVLALAEEFVPVRLIYDDMPEEVVEQYHERGYPLFELLSPEGETLHSFPGVFESPGFIEHLDDATTADRRRTAPSWDAVHRMAGEYASALSAERARDFGAAYRTLSALARESAHEGLPAAARTGLERIARSAARVVAAAQSQSAGEALVTLREAEREFAATPFESDLRRVRAALETSGRFPTLNAADSDAESPSGR